MAEPLIFTNTTAIKEGQLEAWGKYFQEFSEFIEANEPRLLHFAMYVDEEGAEETIVQVHPDADSMRYHMELLASHEHASGEYLDFTKSRSQVYGTPSDELLDKIRAFGTPVRVWSPEGGFNRVEER
jgi:hypothetical protein